MSENRDRYALPKGWSFEIIDAAEEAYSWVKWALSKPGKDGPLTLIIDGTSDSYALALADAAKAAVEWDRDNAHKPTVPPAWMPEVAREVWEAGIDSEIIAIRALRLALERGHVVEPRKWTEQELLKGAREDAAQALKAAGYGQPLIDRVLRGGADGDIWVTAALQARRNMLREWGAVAAPVVPAADWETALKRIWDAAFIYFAKHGLERRASEDAAARREAVSAILSTLPTREA